MNGYELIEILKKNPEDTVLFATENTGREAKMFEIPPKPVKNAKSVKQWNGNNSYMIISG